MKKLTISLSTLLLIIIQLSIINNQLKAQDNVGIGTNDPDEHAILDLDANDKGLLIPRLTNVERTNLGSVLTIFQTGLLVFDINDIQFYYWDGSLSQWVTIGGGGGGCVTLDEAYDCGGAGVGRIITSDAGAVEINASIASSIALKVSHSNVGAAISAESTISSNSFSTIQSTSNSTQTDIAAVLGHSNANAYGVGGQVDPSATSEAAVFGNNLRTNGGHGVLGNGYNGIVGQSNYADGYGVYGSNTGAIGSGDGIGVYGIGSVIGVMGQLDSPNGNAVFGNDINTTSVNSIGVAGLGVIGILGQSSNLSLSFGILSNDDLGVTNILDIGGDFFAGGTKWFRIDHPLDPENKFLRHSCIESPEILNLYRGSIVLDANGEAIVELPHYFESININFTYHLTPIGNSAPNLYVKEEIKNLKFQIAGGNPGLKVSWVVYAERNDLYLQKNPQARNAEPIKEGRYKGKYVHPELYNQPETKSVFYVKQLKNSTNSQSELLKLNPPINTSKKEQLNIIK